MELRAFDPETDFEKLKSWIRDGREHAMWCAGRFRCPLEKGDLTAVLFDMERRAGGIPLIAAEGGKAVGFLCLSLDDDTREGRLKFVIVDPDLSGTGTAREMLRLVISYAFDTANAKRVSLTVFSENHRAKRCYEKAGFTERKASRPPYAYGEETWSRCEMALERPI